MARVVLTQPAPRVDAIATMLAARGHEVISLPARRLLPAPDAARWADGEAPLERHDVVVFVSPSAARFALDRLGRPWPASVTIGAIGPASAAAIRAHPAVGADVRIVAATRSPFDADALMREPPFDHPMGLSMLIVRGERGRDDWIESLRAAGASIAVVALYRSEPIVRDAAALDGMRRWSSDGAHAAFVFTTVDAVDALSSMLDADRPLADWARRQRALAPHPRIDAALRARGWRRARVIDPGERALVAGIESDDQP